ncbi:MAG: glutamate-5-semialdehyde dehydrogenase [Clostridia bacterium]|nr:glutamate-5-semialdehyde dehydrogenase [Clostridia bacterium]
MFDLTESLTRAKNARAAMAAASTEAKNAFLLDLAQRIMAESGYILEKNREDLENARLGGMREVMLDRLALSQERLGGIADAMKSLAGEADPVGVVTGGGTMYNGISMTKKTVPVGVIAVIYEARPNVTADAGALCIKSGNVCVLKGGKEAFNSNKAISEVMKKSLAAVGLPPEAVCFIEDNSRETTARLMREDRFIDLLIPRGGAGLIRSCRENASMPVIETGTGNCHVYIDASADIDTAVKILENAKTQRISVCNTCESLLIHKDVAELALLPIGEMLSAHGVEIRGDEAVRAVLPFAVEATEEDWGTEYLDKIISVKVVGSVGEAIEHINRYSTHHSEAIVTSDYESAERFLSEVDSAAVYVNASTRFTDGGEFGFGAEIGISTGRLHVRGPVGLKDLVTYKYLLRGNGQIRQ